MAGESAGTEAMWSSGSGKKTASEPMWREPEQLIRRRYSISLLSAVCNDVRVRVRSAHQPDGTRASPHARGLLGSCRPRPSATVTAFDEKRSGGAEIRMCLGYRR